MENQIENWTENCECIANAISDDYEAHDTMNWVLNCLLKKSKRGIVPDKAQLVYSSIIAKIVREVIKKNHARVTTKERKALHVWTADRILAKHYILTNIKWRVGA